MPKTINKVKIVRRHLRKQPLITFAVFLLLMAGALSLYSYYRVPTATEIQAAQDSQNNAKAKQLIDKAISRTSSKPDKAKLYVQLGATESNDHDTQAAIAAYQQAASTNGMTSTIAMQLGYAYQAAGDKQNAVKYLQIAIDLWPANDPVGEDETNSLKDQIAVIKDGQ